MPLAPRERIFSKTILASDKGNFSSTRGKFSFDKNHHPIQDIYVREVIKEGKILTNKIVSVGLKNHSNVYVSECNM